MGLTALLLLRRKASCGFFRPKNPRASAECEPVNLGTKAALINFLIINSITRLRLVGYFYCLCKTIYSNNWTTGEFTRRIGGIVIESGSQTY